jgi:hypothetical protein
MRCESVAGLRLCYAPEEQEAARIVRLACERTVGLLRQRWGLTTPDDCRVYVMTSWSSFLLHSAPWPWKVYLVLTFPLVAYRAKGIWPYAGGWSVQYGARGVAGIKPPRLLQMADRTLGETFFTEGRTLNEIVKTVTCHELTHVFTYHLKLPTWLREGVATLAMEHYLGRCIVRTGTLDQLVVVPPSDGRRRGYDRQKLIAQYARGYWLTRFIEETRPDLLLELLSAPLPAKALENRLAAAHGTAPGRFWQEIDAMLQTRYATEAGEGIVRS